jgi:hypothetical protein
VTKLSGQYVTYNLQPAITAKYRSYLSEEKLFEYEMALSNKTSKRPKS